MSIDAERAVIGCGLITQRCVEEAIDLGITDAHFDDLSLRRAWSALRRCEAPDYVTVMAELEFEACKEPNGGWGRLLAQCEQAVATREHLGDYCRILRESLASRHARHIGEGLIKGLCDQDDIEHAQRELAAIQDGLCRGSTPYRHVGAGIVDLVNKIFSREASKPQEMGVPTGLDVLDHALCGLQPGNLSLIAARPSMGKTALMAHACYSAACAGHPTLMLSLEQTEEELVERILSAETRIPGARMKRNEIAPQERRKIHEVASRLHDIPLYVDDSSAITPPQVRAKTRAFVGAHPGQICLLTLDYIQLMRGEARHYDNRNEEVSDISRSLKALMKELHLCSLILSQLNRECEKRQDKRPQLCDLRESGSLEQDADVIAFIYRDDFYNLSSNVPGEAEIIIGKHRNGARSTLMCHFSPETTRFS